MTPSVGFFGAMATRQPIGKSEKTKKRQVGQGFWWGFCVWWNYFQLSRSCVVSIQLKGPSKKTWSSPSICWEVFIPACNTKAKDEDLKEYMLNCSRSSLRGFSFSGAAHIGRAATFSSDSEDGRVKWGQYLLSKLDGWHWRYSKYPNISLKLRNIKILNISQKKWSIWCSQRS